MYWLTTRHVALIELYGEKVVDQRPLWTDPELLADFITYLCRGVMRKWQMTDNGKIVRPESAAVAPRIDNAFLGVGAESTTLSVAAKPR